MNPKKNNASQSVKLLVANAVTYYGIGMVDRSQNFENASAGHIDHMYGTIWGSCWNILMESSTFVVCVSFVCFFPGKIESSHRIEKKTADENFISSFCSDSEIISLYHDKRHPY